MAKSKLPQLGLGVEAQDKVTGFKGIVTGRAEYLTGCTQFCLVPKHTGTGSSPEGSWYDEGRLMVTGAGISKAAVVGPINGGPQRDMPRGK